MRFIRVVLKPQATWKDIQQTGWTPKIWERWGCTTFKRHEPYKQYCQSRDGRCSITYLQDPLREIRYYHLSGTDLEAHAAIIRDRMPTYDHGEIEALMVSAQTPTEKIVAVYHAAASVSSECDAALLAFLTRSLTDPEPIVRRAAVDATLVALWSDFRVPLERVALADPNADVRAFAGETLETLQAQVWGVTPEKFDYIPLPPDPRRITPLAGVYDDWYEAAFGERSALPPAEPVPSRKREFCAPGWLVTLMREGNWDNVNWYSSDQIRVAASQFTEFVKPQMVLLEEDLAANQLLWESMVPVAEGPEFTDRVGRTERSRLFINRDGPQNLLLALAAWHPPTLWVPAGRTRAEVNAATNAYFFPGIPPQGDLPFQGRLFLDTQATLGGPFVGLERGVGYSPFTDLLPWGNSQPVDPYPDSVTLGEIPADDMRRFLAQVPNEFPRTSIRTRYSRAIIQLIDRKNAYFADLYFRPISPPGWAESHNDRMWTDFPPGTPVDVVGALSGLACIGPERIRPQAAEATDDYQRRGMQEIIEFLERAPALV